MPIDRDPLPQPAAKPPAGSATRAEATCTAASGSTTEASRVAAATAEMRDLDACPSCEAVRKNPGRPGSRYCMMCDQTY